MTGRATVRRLPTRLLLLGSLGAALLFIAVAEAVTGVPARGGGIVATVLATFDETVPVWLAASRRPLLTTVMTAVTSLGGGIGIATMSIAGCAWLIWRQRLRAAAVVGLGTGGAALAMVALKAWFDRPRPSWIELPAVVTGSGSSFPSGHACLSVVVAGLLWISLRPGAATRPTTTASAATRPTTTASPATRPCATAALLAVTVAVLGAIGFSRVYLGVHYPSDVLGGWLVGIVWVLGGAALIRRYEG